MSQRIFLMQLTNRIVRFALRSLQELIRGLVYFVYPPFCLVCEKDLRDTGQLVCERCWSSFEFIDRPSCKKCGAPLTVPAETCPHCRGKQFLFSATRAAYSYTEDIRTVIHAFKFQRKISLAKRLGRIVAFAIIHDTRCEEVDYLVPVPLHPSRLRERGYNQSDLLAREISAELGVKCISDILVRRKRTKAMTALTPERRLRNVERAFAVIRPALLKGKNVTLVDDVFTTGATVNACAHALRQAGVAEVNVLTIARASSCAAT